MKSLRFIGVLVLMALAPALAFGEVFNDSNENVKSRAHGFLVKYKDGGQEKYLVTYKGYFGQHRVQEGESSRTEVTWDRGYPEFRVHAIDDRRCRWTLSSTILRQLFMVNRAGEQFPRQELDKVLDVTHSGRGEGATLVTMHAQSCVQAEANYQNEISVVKKSLLDQFDALVDKDLEAVKGQLSTKLKEVQAVERLN